MDKQTQSCISSKTRLMISAVTAHDSASVSDHRNELLQSAIMKMDVPPCRDLATGRHLSVSIV
jgi:hypothetical protein